MGKYLGDQNQLGFFYEPNTYGTGSNVGTPQWIGLVQEHTVSESTNVIPIRYQGSTDRNVDTFANGALDFEGAFTYFPQDWKMLGFAIGSISETSTGSHFYTETNSDDLMYAGSTSSLVSFTLEDSKNYGTVGSNFIRTIGGCKINTYTINWAQGEITSCDVDYIAQAGSLGSGGVITVTPTTTAPFMWNDTIFYMSGADYAGSIANATSATFTVNNNLERGHYVNGSREISDLSPLNRDYELSLTLSMDSVNAKYLYQHYISGTTFNVASQSIGAAAGSLYLWMSGCKVTEMEVPSPMEGLTEQTATIIPQHVNGVAYDAIAKHYAHVY